MPEVITDQEVYLNGVYLPLKGTVQSALLTQMPEKVVMGDATRADQRVAAEWVLADNRGGLGVEWADTRVHQDRYWWSTADTRRQRTLCLPPLVTTTKTTTNADLDPQLFVEYAGALWCVAGEVVYRYDPALGKWEAMHSLLPDATPTDIIVYDDVLHIACGDSYATYDGTTWRDAEMSNEGATHYTIYDNLLIKIDANGVIKARPQWGPSEPWETVTTLRTPASEVQGLVTYIDAQGNPCVYIVTERGLFALDYSYRKVYPTALQVQPAESNGWACCVWHDGMLYYSEQLAVHRYQPGTVQSIGPNRDDGLPATYRGFIRQFVPTPDYLLALVDNLSLYGTPIGAEDRFQLGGYFGGVELPQTLGYSCILAYNAQGWHTLYASPQQNQPIRAAIYSTIGGEPRLWVSDGGRCRYLRLPDGTVDPTRDPNSTFAQSAEYVSSWHDGGLAEVPKVALSIKMRARTNRGQQLTEGAEVLLAYQVDDEADWHELTNYTESGGVRTYLINNGHGVTYRIIRFKVSLRRLTDDVALTPVVVYLALRFQRVFAPLWGWTFRVDLSRPHRGLQPEAMLAHLEATAASVPLVEFAWREQGNFQTRLVRLTQLQGQTTTGRLPRGQWQVTVAEAVSA